MSPYLGSDQLLHSKQSILCPAENISFHYIILHFILYHFILYHFITLHYTKKQRSFAPRLQYIHYKKFTLLKLVLIHPGLRVKFFQNLFFLIIQLSRQKRSFMELQNILLSREKDTKRKEIVKFPVFKNHKRRL